MREAIGQYGGETKLLEEIVEPTYDDDKYKQHEVEVIPSIHVKIKHDEDDFRKPVEEVVEPTYEDGYESAHEKVVPTMEGSAEEENSSGEDSSGEESSGENNSGEESSGEDSSGEESSGEESSGEDSEKILESLDYQKLSSEIDSRNLSEDLKAEFKLTLYQDIDYKVDVNITIDSDIWTIEPNTLTFSSESAEQNSFFFSELVYDSLKASYAESKGEKIGEKYLNSAQKEYDEGIAKVEEEEEEAEKEANAVYEKSYEDSIENTEEKIQDAENILEDLEGGSILKNTYYLNKFKNRTHKRR